MTAAAAATATLLRVEELVKSFEVRRPLLGRLRRRPARRLVAVDRVSFELAANRTLGIVGESGSGKTTLARCLTRLVEPDSGSIEFDGRELLGLPSAELQRLRRQMQIVFQDPYSSLNPQLTVGAALGEALRVHGIATRADVAAHVEELLGLVGLPARTARRYPRELSGGQRQRVAIARALAPRPRLLIADEAVSALDVSIQAQILNLLVDLTERLSLTTIFISHQLSVIAHVADEVAVMYLGRIVESGPVDEVFGSPQHPYTAALLAAHPEAAAGRRRREAAVRGDVPSPLEIPAGCRFRTRCPYAQARCAEVDPPPDEVAPGHAVRCVVLPFR